MYLINQLELLALALFLRSSFLDRFHIGMTAFTVVLLVYLEHLKLLESDVAFCAEELSLFLFGGHCFAFYSGPLGWRWILNKMSEFYAVGDSTAIWATGPVTGDKGNLGGFLPRQVFITFDNTWPNGQRWLLSKKLVSDSWDRYWEYRVRCIIYRSNDISRYVTIIIYR